MCFSISAVVIMCEPPFSYLAIFLPVGCSCPRIGCGGMALHRGDLFALSVMSTVAINSLRWGIWSPRRWCRDPGAGIQAGAIWVGETRVVWRPSTAVATAKSFLEIELLCEFVGFRTLGRFQVRADARLRARTHAPVDPRNQGTWSRHGFISRSSSR
jgi:hypothetical protein